MDCQRARQIMNGTLPDSSLNESDWEQAAIHLEDCSECDRVFRTGDAFDQQIASAMHEVSVPSHLKSQLLTTLSISSVASISASATETETVTTPATDAGANSAADPHAKPLYKRRGWLITVGTAACLLVCALVAIFQRPKVEPFTLAELQEQAVRVNFAELAEFSGDFNPSNLDLIEEWRFAPIRLSETPKGFHPKKTAEQVAAIYQFKVPLRNGQTDGLLVIVPTSELNDAPTEESFSIREPSYLRTSAGNFATVSWTEGDLSYTCLVRLVPGAGDPLERLQLVLDGEIV